MVFRPVQNPDSVTRSEARFLRYLNPAARPYGDLQLARIFRGCRQAAENQNSCGFLFSVILLSTGQTKCCPSQALPGQAAKSRSSKGCPGDRAQDCSVEFSKYAETLRAEATDCSTLHPLAILDSGGFLGSPGPHRAAGTPPAQPTPFFELS